MAVLARGGNAFDAVVAGGFVLQVVEPHMCGPGGEVPAVFVTAADPTPRVLCGQGVAPRRATTALLRDELGLAAIPGTGLLPATVPGAWDGWLTLLRDHGTLSLAEVLNPALGMDGDQQPEVVVEVTYNEIQRSPQYSSGFALRFARITRIRDDKGPAQITTLSELQALYDRQFRTKHRPSV